MFSSKWKVGVIFILASVGVLAFIYHDYSKSVITTGSIDASWSKTDFSKSSISMGDVMSGGPPKDGIPAIDDPIFKNIADIKDLSANEPVISLMINGDARAYPIRILMFHEIVNDVVGEVPVSITYCPLCNTSLTFLRTVDGKILDFGTTGKLRLSNMIMYDRQTESWWQQATGSGIVGKYTDVRLQLYPSRMESFALFKKRYPAGKVLVANNSRFRSYGTNPYVRYDSQEWPFLYRGEYSRPPDPLVRLVSVGDDAWLLEALRVSGRIEYKDIIITWEQGQNSALDSSNIQKGADVGNVVVTKNGEDVVYDVPFAFVFKAFHPDGVIHLD